MVRPSRAGGLDDPDRHADPARRPGRSANRRRTRTSTYSPLFPLDAWTPASSSRAGAIGPAPAGPNDYYALEYYKQLVPNAEVTLPGSTCATCDPTELSPANTWTPQNLAPLVERLGGAIVATHSQSGIMGHHMARILKERGHLDLLKGLITLEGSCSLPNSGLKAADFDNIPYMALKGDYTATSEVCQTRRSTRSTRGAPPSRARRRPTTSSWTRWASVFNGMTHMMMLGTNNLEIADVILNWAGKNIRANARSSATR